MLQNHSTSIHKILDFISDARRADQSAGAQRHTLKEFSNDTRVTFDVTERGKHLSYSNAAESKKALERLSDLLSVVRCAQRYKELVQRDHVQASVQQASRELDSVVVSLTS